MAAPVASIITAVGKRVGMQVVRQFAMQQAQKRAPGLLRGLAIASGGLMLLVMMLCNSLFAMVSQQSTLTWPVPVPQQADAAAGWQSGGWQIASRYAWRRDPAYQDRIEFHDGVDLAGPMFALGAGVLPVLDGAVDYLGWDEPNAPDPSTAGGGMLVKLASGTPITSTTTTFGQNRRDTQYTTLYAHLQPYRLFVRIEGRIDDSYGRYDAGYYPVGSGELVPSPTLTLDCTGTSPIFVPRQTGPGEYAWLFDKPADCTARVAWGQHGGDWEGWIPENATEVQWTTQIKDGQAFDTALLFRAKLIPPPPPPSPTPGVPAVPRPPIAIAEPLNRALTHPPVVIPTPLVPAQAGVGGVADQAWNRSRDSARACSYRAGVTHCQWALDQIPSLRDQDQPLWLTQPNDHATQASSPPASTPDEGGTMDPPHRPAVLPDAQASTLHGVMPATPHPRAHGAVLLPALHDQPTDTAPPVTSVVPPQSPATASGPEESVVRPHVAITHRSTSGNTASRAQDSCIYVGLERITGRAGNSRMHPAAAESFEFLRERVRDLTGDDALAVLADVLRRPGFTSDKAGVDFHSWHKAGRAIDLNLGGPWRIVPEGARYRVYHRPTGVDITALFEAAGWRRIPQHGAVAEWWHYEYRADDVAWETAMRQVWPLDVLQRELPMINWPTIDCQGSGEPPVPVPADPACTTVPIGTGLQGAIEAIAGSGAVITSGYYDTRVINGKTVLHKGIDIATPAGVGRTIHAYMGGTVLTRATGGIEGNYLILRGDDGRHYYYGHMQFPALAGPGTHVTTGERIGYIGATGYVTGPHIHVQVSEVGNKTWIDPEPILGGYAGGTSSLCPPAGSMTTVDGITFCQAGSPTWHGHSEEVVPGCGPPVTLGVDVRQLDDRIGFVGLTGKTTGPHLHLGVQVRPHDGTNPLVVANTQICQPPYLDDALAPFINDTDRRGAPCFSEWADPLEFLPRAHAGAPLPQATAAPADSEPYQLPPPGVPGALVREGPATDDIEGEYWSPYQTTGRFGGGSLWAWITRFFCWLLPWVESCST